MTGHKSLQQLAEEDEARQTEAIIGTLRRAPRPVQQLPEIVTIARRSPLPWLILLVAAAMFLGKSRGGTIDWE